MGQGEPHPRRHDEQARLGDPGMMRLVEWDTPREMFVKDCGYLDENRERLARALR